MAEQFTKQVRTPEAGLEGPDRENRTCSRMAHVDKTLNSTTLLSEHSVYDVCSNTKAPFYLAQLGLQGSGTKINLPLVEVREWKNTLTLSFELVL